MSNPGGTRLLKAKVITDPNIAGGTTWTVRLNPENLDLDHPGNEHWFLKFDNSVVVGTPKAPKEESDLKRSTFALNLSVNAQVEECRQLGTQPQKCQTKTIQDFFAKGAKHQPGTYNNDTSIDPNGNIGDPTSVSSLC